MKRIMFKAISIVLPALFWTHIALAAWPVFDATNFAQNILQASRALEQINNQIRSLQNQATMLQNMARNLERLDYSSASQMMSALDRIDGLMMQADGIGFDVAELDLQLARQYPDSYEETLKASDVATAARERWQNTMDAYRKSLRLQAGIAGNIQQDRPLLNDLVARSQGAPGALAAQQTANQLLALSTKQQMQIQSMLVAQQRAETQDRARKAQSEESGRALTKRFLGTSSVYDE
ncbi:P-type conjugative transfer protein TrbJ [Thalassospira sp. MBR-102]|jgi:P-type conjugative transfer protein TrbJ|uniref:P-type conjugative transfer protein TrbJ n=1 Tax=Thalassospira sp. MBR-102 TaxID=3156466 RepID=UPI00339551C2